MAILKMSGIVATASGKLGGSILQNTSNGVVLKNNAYSQQRFRPRQTIARNKVFIYSQEWSRLTPSQRASWGSQVVNYPYINRIGEIAYYTAYGLFLKLNANNLLIGGSLLLDPPFFSEVIIPQLDTPVITTSSFEIDYISADTETSIVAFASSPRNNSLNLQISQLLQIDIVPLLTVSGTIDLYEAYVQNFGAIPLGKYISFAFKTVINDNGGTTDYSQPEVIVVV